MWSSRARWNLARCHELQSQDTDLGLGVVDAGVVALLERLGEEVLATLDHRHFGVVRHAMSRRCGSCREVVRRRAPVRGEQPFRRGAAHANDRPSRTCRRCGRLVLACAIEAAMERQGWGLWALEELATGRFLGFTGLARPLFDAPFMPAVEVGWRLARPVSELLSPAGPPPR